MKVCIVYDTRRGATATIANWIAEDLAERGFEVSVQRLERAEISECDLVILGAPVYYETPLPSMLKFIEKNRDILAGKIVAVFVVCMADIFGRIGAKYAERRYLGKMTAKLKRPPFARTILRGWLKTQNSKTREQVASWVSDIVGALSLDKK